MDSDEDLFMNSPDNDDSGDDTLFGNLENGDAANGADGIVALAPKSTWCKTSASKTASKSTVEWSAPSERTHWKKLQWVSECVQARLKLEKVNWKQKLHTYATS